MPEAALNQNAIPDRQKPVHEVRLGSVKAAVWRNESEFGPRYNATFSRLYKDGEQWKTTSSFGRDDLLVVAKLADRVHTWMMDHGHEK